MAARPSATGPKAEVQQIVLWAELATRGQLATIRLLWVSASMPIMVSFPYLLEPWSRAGVQDVLDQASC
jgi:hypothetical protein